MSRPRTLAARLGVLAVAALAATAGIVPPATATTESAARDRAPAAFAAITPTAVTTTAMYTRITVQVYGCEGCTIGIQRALASGSRVRPARPTYWGGVRAVVRRGIAVLRMPTAWTPGSSMTISAPWAGEFGFQPNVVARYYGYAPRSLVSASRAASARAATACWAGTVRSSATIVVRVVKAGPARDLNGRSRYLPRAWAYPTLPTAGNRWQATSRGIIGNQDAFYC